jgi:hypothetical protein
MPWATFGLRLCNGAPNVAFDPMKVRLPFAVASFLCAPLLVVLVAYFTLVASRLLSVEYPGIAFGILFYAMVFLAVCPPASLTFLVIVSISLVAVWRQERKTRFELIASGIYGVLVIVSVVFVVWCLVANRTFDDLRGLIHSVSGVSLGLWIPYTPN